MEPASADSGFFQESPILRNQFEDDPSLGRVLRLFLPPNVLAFVVPELSSLGDKVLSQEVFDAVTDAERNTPYLRGNGRDAFGRPRGDSLVVTEGWTKLQNFGIENGFVAYNYDQSHKHFNRIIQMSRLLLWEASSANTTCPSAMQDGAARLLQRQLAKSDLDPTHRHVFQNAYTHLISRKPGQAWTSGQWMTERAGGSDVSQTETMATLAPFQQQEAPPLASASEDIPLGPWSISGFKWFSSATDASMTILLARTHPSKPVSAFFAPLQRHSASVRSPTGPKAGSAPNGVRIARLKDKMGTRSLPTAELELRDMRGWLIGEEGQGIQEIATILTITRLHSSIAALGYLGRGLAVARGYALVRQVGAGRGRRVPLWKNPLHMRTLATITSEYHGMMLLTFYTASLLGLDEHPLSSSSFVSSATLQPPPPQHVVAPLLRVLSSLTKAYVCKASIPLFYSCMEALGGLGYLHNAECEHLNLARLFRDLCVLATWEGTTNVLAVDTLRALKHPRDGARCLDALRWLLGRDMALLARLEGDTMEALLPEAGELVVGLAEAAMGRLLDLDGERGTVGAAMRARFLAKRGGIFERDGKSTLEVDTAIVFGERRDLGSAQWKL